MSSWTLSLAGRAAQHVGSSLCVPQLADFAWGAEMRRSLFYGSPGKSGLRPGFRPACADNMPPPSPCQANSKQFLPVSEYLVPNRIDSSNEDVLIVPAKKISRRM